MRYDGVEHVSWDAHMGWAWKLSYMQVDAPLSVTDYVAAYKRIKLMKDSVL